jgi:glycine dehydrogenase subunit 1
MEILSGPTFNEFTVMLPVAAEKFVKKMLAAGFAAGLPASLFYKDKARHLIISATEKRSADEIDHFVAAVKKALS